MKKIFALVALTVTVAACSNTQNEITMTVTQGACVQASMYASSVTPPSVIVKNPTTAPYCASVTIRNNNSGKNANNIQVINSGSYNGLAGRFTVGTKSYSATLYDPIAAGVPISGSQNIGNVMLYDPYNCATTQGANVRTLNQGGGNCTFYLQLAGESFPAGVYPINLTYNYTNGNQNYSQSTSLNQRVYLYGGANTGVYFNASTAPTIESPSWKTGLTNAPTAPISYLIADGYGNVYMASNNAVYMYNGSTTIQIGASLNASVTALAFDSSGNLYAATAGTGIYLYNKNANPAAWVQFNDSQSNLNSQNIIGLKGAKYAGSAATSIAPLYAITQTGAYYCANPNATSLSCQWLAIPANSTPPSRFLLNAIDTDPQTNLYVGSLATAYTTGMTGMWQQYFPATGPNITGSVYGVRFNPLSSPASVYFSEVPAINNLATESSVYTCTTPAIAGGCIPLISSANAAIMGNAYAITTDGAGNVYVAGSSLNSADYSNKALNTYGAYLLLNPSVNGGASSWAPITNGSMSSNTNNVQALVVSSMLTTN